MREYRKKKGLTQNDLATCLQISVTYLNKLETGHLPMRPKMAARIAYVLDCRLIELIQDKTQIMLGGK
jgi:transcriptional regulator with XRE-family HTH domain